ncbi:unnamed protein product [Toxocara canis]|uniref:TLC domain-containing protein 2 n=1 Tax=Toxocara canis TaxID=6265 RepID=A0A183ULD2_TOXCA|nr:unnamed protein product [Toxocara canis]
MLEAGYVGAEWRMPPIRRLFEPSFFAPIIGYFFLFEGIAYCIRSSIWSSHPPFERYRLRNLSVSLVHSAITGGCALAFMLLNPGVMFHDTMHWYEAWAAQLPLLSMGYFCHDAVDILNNERSKYAFEILLHHVVIFSIFSVGMISHKFLPYAYWALLVEVSSVFIHMRTILEISMLHAAHGFLYRMIRILSLATIVVFRFGVLLWMLHYIIVNRRHFHAFYMCAGILADVFFLVLSLTMFFRMLAQDGFFGERARRKASIQRKDEKDWMGG